MRIIKLSYKEIQWLKGKYTNGEVLHLNKASILKTCEWCNKLYTPTHHKQKFCTKKCYREHRLEYKNNWDRTKRKRKPSIGTGYIKGTPNEDFDKEEKILKKELRRLGLNKR